jgi:hypothetical protein
LVAIPCYLETKEDFYEGRIAINLGGAFELAVKATNFLLDISLLNL